MRWCGTKPITAFTVKHVIGSALKNHDLLPRFSRRCDLTKRGCDWLSEITIRASIPMFWQSGMNVSLLRIVEFLFEFGKKLNSLSSMIVGDCERHAPR